MWRINGTEAPKRDVIGEKCMVGNFWGRYERDYIYVRLTRMGANGEGVLLLVPQAGRLPQDHSVFDGVTTAYLRRILLIARTVAPDKSD